MMVGRSRTHEFQHIVEAVRNRNLPPGMSRPSAASVVSGRGGGGHRTEFNRRAADIAAEMADAAAKLAKLSELTKRSSVFDDRPVEINQLTHTVKSDVARLNKAIASLQQFSRASAATTGIPGSRNGTEHAGNAIVHLQSRLAAISEAFREVLEQRSVMMKSSRDRREQFSATPGSHSSGLIPHGAGPLFHPDRSASRTPDPHGHMPSSRGKDDSFSINMGPDDGSQQLLLFEQRSEYSESRASAIESIESTIQELGGIFSQLSRMVSEQRDMVTRIEANVDDMHANISGAQRELLKYYRSISSNRALMLKLFALLLLFFFLYVVVL